MCGLIAYMVDRGPYIHLYCGSKCKTTDCPPHLVRQRQAAAERGPSRFLRRPSFHRPFSSSLPPFLPCLLSDDGRCVMMAPLFTLSVSLAGRSVGRRQRQRERTSWPLSLLWRLSEREPLLPLMALPFSTRKFTNFFTSLAVLTRVTFQAWLQWIS